MKPRHLIHILAMLLAVLVLSCASDSEADSIFSDIESRIKSDPDSAVRFVDSLSSQKEWQKRLSESARARFDLLRVKSADKAYIRHTSDSLIRSVLTYYENHTGSEHYPEALYYGGRVYSDLGDSPTALRYFQQALDVLKESDNDQLLTRALSQTARLLTSRRLYTEAIPYIDRAIEIEDQKNDTVSLVYDIEFAGAIRMHAGKYDEADKCFRKSMSMAKDIDTGFVIQNRMQLAAIRYYKKEIDSALSLIRPIVNIRDSELRRTILTYAADIYLRANKLDTALTYAKELLASPIASERKHGYQVLLDNSLSAYVPKDSMGCYIREYRKILEDNWSQSENRQVQIQNSKFNYQKHDEARAVAEEKKNAYAVTGLVLLLVVLGLCLAVAVIRQRNNRNKLDLYEALENIRILRDLLKSPHARKNGSPHDIPAFALESGASGADAPYDAVAEFGNDAVLRRKLRNELLELISVSSTYSRNFRKYILPEEISASDAYKKLTGCLARKKALPSGSKIWEELSRLSDAAWPDFHKKLCLLMGSKISENDYRLCLLIRLGFSPTDITVLLGRTKGTISSRRARLCKEILGENAGATGFDIVILSL